MLSEEKENVETTTKNSSHSTLFFSMSIAVDVNLVADQYESVDC